WVDAGTRRVASYPHLPPGQYVFELKARAGASLWNENSAALAFELPSRFHHRWSFRIAAIGLAVLVLGGLVRWRLAHLRWQAEQLEATIEARTAELTHEREILRAVNRRLGRTNEQLQ